MSPALKVFFLSIITMLLMVLLARGGDGYRQENYLIPRKEAIGEWVHLIGVLGFVAAFLTAIVSITLAIVQA